MGTEERTCCSCYGHEEKPSSLFGISRLSTPWCLSSIGIVKCKYCTGTGVLEIRPFRCKTLSFIEASNSKDFSVTFQIQNVFNMSVSDCQ